MHATTTFTMIDPSFLRFLLLLVSIVRAINQIECYLLSSAPPPPQRYHRWRSWRTTRHYFRTSLAKDDSDADDDFQYVIEYSMIFHRHVVYRYPSNVFKKNDDDDADDDTSGRLLPPNEAMVVQSFLFLDDARTAYPHAALLPVTTMSSKLSSSSSSISSSNGGIAGCPHDMAYPRMSHPTTTTLDDGESVYEIFHRLLGWTTTEVDQHIIMTSKLQNFHNNSDHGSDPHQFDHSWQHPQQLRQLRDRLQFLCAPLPPPDILHQTNVTDDVDWPYLFYHHHHHHHDGPYGAGLTPHQVTVALQGLPPAPNLLLRQHFGANADDDDSTNDSDNRHRQQLAVLYEQTPPAVVQMTISSLHLWVTGVTPGSIIALAYLHWQACWDWTSCRIVCHAFRSSLPCHTEPSWQQPNQRHYNNNNNNNRDTLMLESLSYLQAELQIRPWHIRAMLQTHSRLAGYTPQKLQHNIHCLRHEVQFRSSEIQAIVLQMPSLLGASVDSLQSHVTFWITAVGLTRPQLRDAVRQQPALLQYNIQSNLQLKLDFFRNDFALDDRAIRRMTMAFPEIWGRSLEHYYRPFTESICVTCGNMTRMELGGIIGQVPELLLYNPKTIYGKLEYLQNRLGLGGKELKDMVLTSPRVLKQSIGTSLDTKIELIETMSSKGSTAKTIIQKYPSILTLSKANVQKRLQRSMHLASPTMSLSDALDESKKNRRSNKAVWLMSTATNHSDGSTTGVDLEFSDVTSAALHAETSVSNMYKILRNGNVIHGRHYVYATNKVDLATTTTATLAPSNMTVPVNSDPSRIQKSSIVGDPFTPNLCIHTAGRAFPPEDTVRGRKRSGGMALQIRNWSSQQWGASCSNLWKGQRLRLLPDGNTLIIGYPYTRPSRRRCSLYACREALRVTKQWLLQQNSSSAIIKIACESNYVLNLLHNSTRLYEWGKAESIDAFRFDGPGELYEANPDILYSIARLYFLLQEWCDVSDVEHRKNVTIDFISSDTSDHSKRLRDGAKLAATLMYETVR